MKDAILSGWNEREAVMIPVETAYWTREIGYLIGLHIVTVGIALGVCGIVKVVVDGIVLSRHK